MYVEHVCYFVPAQYMNCSTLHLHTCMVLQFPYHLGRPINVNFIIVGLPYYYSCSQDLCPHVYTYMFDLWTQFSCEFKGHIYTYVCAAWGRGNEAIVLHYAEWSNLVRLIQYKVTNGKCGHVYTQVKRHLWIPHAYNPHNYHNANSMEVSVSIYSVTNMRNANACSGQETSKQWRNAVFLREWLKPTIRGATLVPCICWEVV